MKTEDEKKSLYSCYPYSAKERLFRCKCIHDTVHSSENGEMFLFHHNKINKIWSGALGRALYDNKNIHFAMLSLSKNMVKKAQLVPDNSNPDNSKNML